MNGQVLVLNATYEPLNIVSLQRAVVLLLKDKAEVLEAAGALIRSERLALELPLVIRLVYFVRVPRRMPLPLTRRSLMSRDHFACQYCGSQPSKVQLTLDHVVPRSRGGRTDWDNVVTACIPCNQRKGDRRPKEAGMRLLAIPEKPRFAAFVLLGRPGYHETWSKYIA